MPKKKKAYMPDESMQEDMMEMPMHEEEDMAMNHMEHMQHMLPMEHMQHMEHMHPMKHILAHAYVPWQKYDRAFSPKEALMKGTLFPELWGVYPIPK